MRPCSPALLLVLAGAVGAQQALPSSTCKVSVYAEGASLADVKDADAATFGRSLSVTSTGSSAILQALPEGCLRGCATVRGNSCASLLSAARGHWVLVDLADSDGLDRPPSGQPWDSSPPHSCGAGGASAPPQAGAPVDLVRSAQSNGAVGVLLVEADDDAPQAHAVPASAGAAVTVPTLWLRRSDARVGPFKAGPTASAYSGVYHVVPSCRATSLPAETVQAFAGGPNRTLYYTYQLPSSARKSGGLLVRADASYGASLLAVSRGDTADSALLPRPGGAAIASAPAWAPVLRLATGRSGVYVVALQCAGAPCGGSLRVEDGWHGADAQPRSHLVPAEPLQLSVGAMGWRRLAVSLPSDSAFTIDTAVLGGEGAIYVCGNDQAVLPTWSVESQIGSSLPSSCTTQPALFGARSAKSGPSASMLTFDPTTLGCSGPCSVLLALFSKSAASVVLTLSTSAAPPVLRTGLPHVTQLTPTQPRSVRFRTTARRFTLSLTPATAPCGEPADTIQLSLVATDSGTTAQPQEVQAAGTSSEVRQRAHTPARTPLRTRTRSDAWATCVMRVRAAPARARGRCAPVTSIPPTLRRSVSTTRRRPSAPRRRASTS